MFWAQRAVRVGSEHPKVHPLHGTSAEPCITPIGYQELSDNLIGSDVEEQLIINMRLRELHRGGRDIFLGLDD